MIITYLRSSSYNTEEWCQQKYFLEYNLGIKLPAGKSADIGTIVHKVLELLAQFKLCQQTGEKSFDDDLLGLITVNKCDPEKILKKVFREYIKTSVHKFGTSDYEECLKLVNDTLEYGGGTYNPLNLNIVSPEQKFDFLIEEDWAKYKYKLPDGKVLEGYLALKGTLDLVVQSDVPGCLHLIDWKTGAIKDWYKKGTPEKNHELLQRDSQLLFYYYAMNRLYPDVEDILVTIYFARWKKPFDIYLSRNDLPMIEGLIRKKFERIKNTKTPKLTIDWRCARFCGFGRNLYPGSDKTYCEYFRNETYEIGMDNVVAAHANLSKISEYGSGGGRQAK